MLAHPVGLWLRARRLPDMWEALGLIPAQKERGGPAQRTWDGGWSPWSHLVAFLPERQFPSSPRLLLSLSPEALRPAGAVLISQLMCPRPWGRLPQVAGVTTTTAQALLWVAAGQGEASEEGGPPPSAPRSTALLAEAWWDRGLPPPQMSGKHTERRSEQLLHLPPLASPARPHAS